LLEVFDILTVSQMILHACRARKTSVKSLCFEKAGSPDPTTGDAVKLIVIRDANNQVICREIAVDFFGPLKKNYEKLNQETIQNP